MFEVYLRDSYEFFLAGRASSKESKESEARRYYRASVFYASGAIEAFINYIADSFAKAGNIPRHEICFLNDRALVFSVGKGLKEKIEYHKLDDKIRLLMGKFVPDFDFQCCAWSKFMDLKSFRDSLVHPRQVEDEINLAVYDEKLRTGLQAIIEIMNYISSGMFGTPLRKQLLDLIPE